MPLSSSFSPSGPARLSAARAAAATSSAPDRYPLRGTARSRRSASRPGDARPVVAPRRHARTLGCSGTSDAQQQETCTTCTTTNAVIKPSSIERLLSEFISDPTALRQRFEGLRARDRASRAKLKDAEKNARELKQLRKEQQGADAPARQRQRRPRRLPRRDDPAQGRPARGSRSAGPTASAAPSPARSASCARAGHKPPQPRRSARGRAAPAHRPRQPPPHPQPATPHTGATRRPSAGSASTPSRSSSSASTSSRTPDPARTRPDPRLVRARARLRARPAAARAPRGGRRARRRVRRAGRAHPRRRPRRARGHRRPAAGARTRPTCPSPGRVMYCAHSTPAYNTNGYSVRTKGVASGLRQAGADVVVVGRSGYPWDSKSDVKSRARHRHAVEVDGVDYVHLPGSPLATHPGRPLHPRVRRRLRPRGPAPATERHPRRLQLPGRARRPHRGPPPGHPLRLRGPRPLGDHRGLRQARLGPDRALRPAVRPRDPGRHARPTPSSPSPPRPATSWSAAASPPSGSPWPPTRSRPREFLPLPRDTAYAATLGVRTDVPVIGFAGSMVPYEGLDVLVDAAALLRDAGVDFQVVVAGSGSAAAALKEQVAALDLGDHVRFVGRVPGDQMPRLLSLFDIMPCPRLSLPVTEMVSPLKPLEAMSSAKAVVLSDVAPHRDIAGPHESRALLFRAGRPPGPRRRPAPARRAARPARRPRSRRAPLVPRRAHLGGAGPHHPRRPPRGERAAPRRRRRRSRRSQRCGSASSPTSSPPRPSSASVHVVPLDRDGWRDQLDGPRPRLHRVGVERQRWHLAPRRRAATPTRSTPTSRPCSPWPASSGCPSVFWNKEDPVHFDRFVATASLCDHVFTTDGNRVLPYLEAGVGTVRTASSLPFYAQPKIHNPLPAHAPTSRPSPTPAPTTASATPSARPS